MSLKRNREGSVAAARELSPETKDRLLEAAGEVFAERGFDAATVREICQRAGANVAAINYHFGDKRALYRATLLHAHRTVQARFPPDGGVPATAPPEHRLRGFISAFVGRLLAEDRPGAAVRKARDVRRTARAFLTDVPPRYECSRGAWHTRLMGREMVEPTGALAELVDEMIRPNYETLTTILRALMRGARADEVRLAANSIVGQCTFYLHCAPILAALAPGARLPGLDRITEHVTAFSLAATDAWRRGRPRRPAVRRARP